MRRFIDLHVRPPNEDSLRAMLELAAKLGYGGLGIVQGGSITESVRGLASDLGIDLARRVDLRPRNPKELTSELGQMRGRFDIVAVDCHSKSVARQAAKDHRVDILDFPAQVKARKRIGFDRQEASLAAAANCSYEINFSDLLGKGPGLFSGLLSMIRGEVENAVRYGVPIVVSSGAGNPLFLRDPRGLSSILGLFDLGEEEGLDAVSKNPSRMLDANRKKLGPGFVIPGVRVV
jgi:RNase P/RNase MRP subunit p30